MEHPVTDNSGWKCVNDFSLLSDVESSESVRLPLIPSNGKEEDIYYEKGVEPH